jgi:Phage protein Gp138 N-terminal domain
MEGTGDRRATLESAISVAIATQLKEVHTILPGQIIKFDPVEQLADIQIQLKRNVNDELITLPVLSQVPVRFMKSGDFTICFPLKENDEVSVYIIERSIDNWLEQGGIQSPNDTRRFDLSDAYAVPILYSQTQKITDFDPDNLVIKSNNGNSKITIKKTGEVIIDTSAGATINGDLDVTGKITSPTIEAGTSLKVANKEVNLHNHGGTVPAF